MLMTLTLGRCERKQVFITKVSMKEDGPLMSKDQISLAYNPGLLGHTVISEGFKVVG